MTENELAKIVVDLCFRIHRDIGPGLFESVYEEVLAHELTKHDLQFKRQEMIPLIYDGLRLKNAFRADFIIGDKLLVELKAVDELPKTYYKQVITYLKLTDLKLGLLVNFNVGLISDGIKRIVNGL